MAGRPKRQFTDEQRAQINQMALDNCHFETIAMALEIPVNTLKRHFGRFIRQKRAEGRTILRRNQVKMSKTIPAMAIFLGKNELEQSDKQEIKHAGSVDVNQPPTDPQRRLEWLKEQTDLLLAAKKAGNAIANG